jgi:4'-phosphopantetheinyl transferase
MIPQVDVFWTDLDAAAGALPRWRGLLDRHENARAARFRSGRDRERYVVCHGILRMLLARYIDRAPAVLRFDTGNYGKPALRNSDLRFNLSHSRHLALFAVSRELAVGCDIELHDERFLADNIPERFFSHMEVAEFRRLPAPDRLAAFFAGWTRKEAYIKARGLGLSLPLDSFEVSLAPSTQPALRRGCDGWSARSIETAPHCSAAVIAASSAWQIHAQPLDALALLAEGRAARVTHEPAQSI